MPTNIQQEYAKFAMERINKVTNKSEYLSMARKMPFLIKQNGLLPSMIYVMKKNKDIESDIIQWLYYRRQNEEIKTNVLDYLIDLKSDELLQTTREIMGLFIWIKNLSEAIIKPEIKTVADLEQGGE